jgi:hypothetical protein
MPLLNLTFVTVVSWNGLEFGKDGVEIASYPWEYVLFQLSLFNAHRKDLLRQPATNGLQMRTGFRNGSPMPSLWS